MECKVYNVVASWEKEYWDSYYGDIMSETEYLFDYFFITEQTAIEKAREIAHKYPYAWVRVFEIIVSDKTNKRERVYNFYEGVETIIRENK